MHLIESFPYFRLIQFNKRGKRGLVKPLLIPNHQIIVITFSKRDFSRASSSSLYIQLY